MRMLFLVPGVLIATLVVSAQLGRAPHADEPTATTTKVKISTPRGVKLEGVLHTPAKPTGVVVVLGSGRGYHMDLPLLTRSAEALQEQGITALRFNWAYFTAKGKHSADLSTEMKDLDAALAYARGLDGIQHVVLAGKSLGSIAAFMRATAKADDLAALVLMTFPIHPPGKPEQLFEDQKKLHTWKKPLLIVCGDADPYSSIKPLYAYCAGFEQAPRLVLAPGDHSFRGPDKDNKAETVKNIELAAHGLARWVAIWAADLTAAK